MPVRAEDFDEGAKPAGYTPRKRVRTGVKSAVENLFAELRQRPDIIERIKDANLDGRPILEFLKHTRKKLNHGEDLTDYHIRWLQDLRTRFRNERDG